MCGALWLHLPLCMQCAHDHSSWCTWQEMWALFFASMRKDLISGNTLKKRAKRWPVSASDLLKLRERVIFTRCSFTWNSFLGQGVGQNDSVSERPRFKRIKGTHLLLYVSKDNALSSPCSRPERSPTPKGHTVPYLSALPHTGFPRPRTVWTEPLMFLTLIPECGLVSSRYWNGTLLVSLLPQVQRPWAKTVVGKYPQGWETI